MKKVIVFIGSARMKATYTAAKMFLEQLCATEPIESEIVFLHKYTLKYCLGCKICFEKGAEFCPLCDDRDILLEKIRTADGVIFAIPNYSFQVSGITKSFLDRLGFMFHRPQYFGKVFTAIVFQGLYGGKSILKYLDFVGTCLGCTTVKGSCLTGLEPISIHDQKRNEKILINHSHAFLAKLNGSINRKPTVMKLMMFRMARSSMKMLLNSDNLDFRYYQENGWFESDYYYPTKLSFQKKLLGKLFDAIALMEAKNKQ